MRSFLHVLIPALLATCGAHGYAPLATAAPPPSLAQDDAFAAQRPLDAPPDPVRVVADGSATVHVALLAPATATPGPDPAAVRAEVERNAGLLQRCWESRVNALPVREGVVQVHAHLGPDGQAHGQCIGEDTVGDESVRRCVNDVVAMGRYPVTDSTADVTLQFRLLPPGR
jgi:hypothetical protein